jgi:hypothetical protein
MSKPTRNPYNYVSNALDQLFLLSQRCSLSVKSTQLLDRAEIALTELLDSVEDSDANASPED